MTTIINASNGSTSGLITTADASGVLQLQTNNGTPALTLNTTQALGVGSTPTYGTSGQVLTSAGSGAAPTWTTPSAGAMTLIQTINVGTQATIAFTGLSGYKKYLMIFNNINTNSNGLAYLYLGYGSTPTYLTSNYYNYVIANRTYNGTGTLYSVNSLNATNIVIESYNPTEYTASGLSGQCLFVGMDQNYTEFFLSDLNPTNIATTGDGEQNQVTGYVYGGYPKTAIKFGLGGNNFVSGTVSLYGISS